MGKDRSSNNIIASSFSAPTSGISGLVADDFNVDGKSDVAITTFNFGLAYVAFGTGSGSLSGFSGYGTSQSASDIFGIASGNLQGTSAPELVVSGYSGAQVRILANSGAGSFVTANAFSVGGNPEQPVIADINGDGFNDIVVGRLGSGGVSITYTNGAGGAISGADCQVHQFTP